MGLGYRKLKCLAMLVKHGPKLTSLLSRLPRMMAMIHLGNGNGFNGNVTFQLTKVLQLYVKLLTKMVMNNPGSLGIPSGISIMDGINYSGMPDYIAVFIPN